MDKNCLDSTIISNLNDINASQFMWEQAFEDDEMQDQDQFQTFNFGVSEEFCQSYEDSFSASENTSEMLRQLKEQQVGWPLNQ